MTTSSPAQLYQEFYGPAIFSPLAMSVVGKAAPVAGERVLDLACGTGIVTRLAASRVAPTGSVIGVDLNPAMLAMARSVEMPSGASIEWHEGDALEVELPETGFDVAFIQQGLQFFPDRPRALERLHGWMRPGGRVAIATWRPVEEQQFFREFAEIEARHLHEVGVTHEDIVAPFAFGDPDALRESLEGAGFQDVRVDFETVDARFPEPEMFTRNLSTAYGAVIPSFVEDRAAFVNYVDAVERDASEIVARHTREDHVCFAMHTNIAVGTA